MILTYKSITTIAFLGQSTLEVADRLLVDRVETVTIKKALRELDKPEGILHLDRP
jgi:hypothetical protein